MIYAVGILETQFLISIVAYSQHYNNKISVLVPDLHQAGDMQRTNDQLTAAYVSLSPIFFSQATAPVFVLLN